MKESVFGEEETENLNAEYGKPPAQPKCVEQAVFVFILEESQLTELPFRSDKLPDLQSESEPVP